MFISMVIDFNFILISMVCLSLHRNAYISGRVFLFKKSFARVSIKMLNFLHQGDLS